MNPERLKSFISRFRRAKFQESIRDWEKFQFPSYEVMQAKIADFLIQQSKERREVTQEFLRVVSGLTFDSPFTVLQWRRVAIYCLDGESDNKEEIINGDQYLLDILNPVAPPNFVSQVKLVLTPVANLKLPR